MKLLAALRGFLNRKPDRQREQGQIMVLFVLVIVVIMGFTSLVIDIGLLRNANQNLWNSLDSGALAGASQLPADATNAEAIAQQYADLNYPGGLPANAKVSFRCVIGVVAGAPRLSDIPAVCDPGANAVWTNNGTIASSLCVPAEGDVCNTIVLESTVSMNYNFGPAIGVNNGSTQPVLSAACKGPCGTKPTSPVDLMVVVDRTSSMSGIDTVNARAAADSVRKAYNPAEQWLGFGMLGPSQSGAGCATAPDSNLGSANLPGDLGRWVPIGLTGIGAPNNANYATAGSAMANAISCYTNSSVGTDLTDPIPMAAWELTHDGRADAVKGIILMTDGQPNNSTHAGSDYCAQSDAAATAAKAAGIEVFTIGFGLDGANDATCPDTAGLWVGKKATTLLASMATDSVDAGCPGTSNDDGDHFYCVPKTDGASTNLADLFKQAASSLVGGTKLIALP